jgi:hypothetical protein
MCLFRRIRDNFEERRQGEDDESSSSDPAYRRGTRVARFLRLGFCFISTQLADIHLSFLLNIF